MRGVWEREREKINRRRKRQKIIKIKRKRKRKRKRERERETERERESEGGRSHFFHAGGPLANPTPSFKTHNRPDKCAVSPGSCLRHPAQDILSSV